ncbi:MAG TPA: biotin/lipoyl-binding protein [Microbacteriaceae bacterium]|nr:biotin/lipoyl-binding protein [Microbacteriaceae bacterium]
MTSAHKHRRHRRRRIVVGSALLVAVLLAAGGAAYAATRPQAPSYRTAAAAMGAVHQTVDLDGQVASSNRRDVAFQTSGTVQAVDVSLGQAVTAGQKLAGLDSSSLESALTDAQNAVTQAKQTLADDLASQTQTTEASSAAAGGRAGGASSGQGTSGGQAGGASPFAGAGGSGTASSGASMGSHPSTGGQGTSADSAAVAAARKAVTTAQQALLAQVTAAQKSLTATDTIVTTATTTCAPFLKAALGGDSSGGAGGTSSTAQQLTDCQGVIDQALASQKATAEAQSKVQSLAATLNTAVAKLQALLTGASTGASSGKTSSGGASPTPGSTGSPSAGRDAPSVSLGRGAGATVELAADVSTSATSPQDGTAQDGSAQSGSGRSASSLSGSASQPASAATIVADQAAVAEKQAAVDVAKQALTFATLTSPIAGTVAAIGVAPGDSVTGGSTTEVITVIGAGGNQVTSTATLTQVKELTVGQTVSVTADGRPLSGHVTSIGVQNVSTDTAATAYDVTIDLDGSSADLLNGTPAQAIVKVASLQHVLTVPTSAIHRNGTAYTVDVLQGGKAVTKTVTVKVQGSIRTAITGVSTGAKVILADLDQQIAGTDSSSSSSSTSGLGGLSGLGGSTGGASRFGGVGGFPAGGFRGRTVGR